MRNEQKASWMGIIGNSLLFIGKIIVGILYNSIALISDGFNSLTDIVSSIIVHLSVIVSYQKADRDHQFGHARAQPIAGLIVAIFIGGVGFEVITFSVKKIIDGGTMQKGILPIVLVLAVLIIKMFMYTYTMKVCRKTGSTALMASAVDHRDDVIVSSAVLVGIVAANLGYPIFDPLVAIAMGLWIIKSGYSIGMYNMKFLMGGAPSHELFEKIEKNATSIEGVLGLNGVRAHYVGTHVEAEVHIYVDKKMNVEEAHTIGKRVQKKLEKMPEICKAFIHIDPFRGKYEKVRRF